MTRNSVTSSGTQWSKNDNELRNQFWHKVGKKTKNYVTSSGTTGGVFVWAGGGIMTYLVGALSPVNQKGLYHSFKQISICLPVIPHTSHQTNKLSKIFKTSTDANPHKTDTQRLEQN